MFLEIGTYLLLCINVIYFYRDSVTVFLIIILEWIRQQTAKKGCDFKQQEATNDLCCCLVLHYFDNYSGLTYLEIY